MPSFVEQKVCSYIIHETYFRSYLEGRKFWFRLQCVFPLCVCSLFSSLFFSLFLSLSYLSTHYVNDMKLIDNQLFISYSLSFSLTSHSFSASLSLPSVCSSLMHYDIIRVQNGTHQRDLAAWRDWTKCMFYL